LADLTKGRRRKRAALEQAVDGRLRAHHRLLITARLAHIDVLDETIAPLSQEAARARRRCRSPAERKTRLWRARGQRDYETARDPRWPAGDIYASARC